VQLIGIDERTQSQVGDFCHYLQHPSNRERISFQLRQSGYDVRDHQGGPDAPVRSDLGDAGWAHRRKWVERERLLESMQPRSDRPDDGAPPPFLARAPLEQPAPLTSEDARPLDPPAPQDPLPSYEARSDATLPGAATASPGADDPNPLRGAMPAVDQPTAQNSIDSSPVQPEAPAASEPAESYADQPAATAPDGPVEYPAAPVNPFLVDADQANTFDPATQQHTGVVLGIALANYRDPTGRDRFLQLPGDDVRLSFPTAGTPPDVTHASFTVVDLYESKMSECDASFVFVPIEILQQYRGMFDPETKVGYATSIQIKLKPGVDGQQVRDLLRAAFVPQLYSVSTWRDKQGPLLAAVQMETAILNVLLFMIIFVAGFGILAIFFMIVVEKTRDIGILKALGASRQGILGIFLGYGLSLGIVGAGAGLTIGLLFVAYINEIADLLGMITGQEVFDPAIYYFQQIPTIVEPATVAWIVSGALVIAVLASVLPARRAARLHPVEALRYE